MKIFWTQDRKSEQSFTQKDMKCEPLALDQMNDVFGRIRSRITREVLDLGIGRKQDGKWKFECCSGSEGFRRKSWICLSFKWRNNEWWADRVVN